MSSSDRHVKQKDFTAAETGIEALAASNLESSWMDVSGFDTLTLFINSSATGAVTFGIDTSNDGGTTVFPLLQPEQTAASGTVTFYVFAGVAAIATNNEGCPIPLNIKDFEQIRIKNLSLTGNATVTARASTL